MAFCLAFCRDNSFVRTGCLLAACCLAGICSASDVDQGLVAWWQFNEASGSSATENVSKSQDQVLNEHEWVAGVAGNALKFDGFSTVIKLAPPEIPAVSGELTVEAWIALQASPWNWVAIVDHESHWREGYFFGVDAEGRLGLQVGVANSWEICQSEEKLPLKQWVHVVGTYDHAQGIRLYMNGKPAGRLPVTGRISIPENTPFQIGRDIENLPPTALIRPGASVPALYSFDGLIDELRIYNRPLAQTEVESRFESIPEPGAPPLPARRWPRLPAQPTHFGAVYTALKLYPEWDALWRTGGYSDVVVNFENSPVHYVFWRGANYEDNLVTENGIWIGDQSYESGTATGTAEHMNDKHTRHQYISILENNPARVVLHWRYGLVDVKGQFSHVDPLSGWGDWADEYFYIYPDGVAVRFGTIHGTARHYSFTEPALLLEPGKKAEDEISLEAVTIANPDGGTKTYNWDPTSPPFPFPDQPNGANVAVLNTKSKYKPFYIYPPGTELGPYGWPPELRLDYSHFPTWDHWPVNQIPSDGRFELNPDHYASAAVMSPELAETNAEGPEPTHAKMFLFGLTTQAIGSLAAIDRSWTSPPGIVVNGEGYRSTGYDPTQRAYQIERFRSEGMTISISLGGSQASPVFNPVLVVKNWGDAAPSIALDGKRASPSDYRLGRIQRLEGTDLVIWLRKESTTPTTITIQPQGHNLQ